MARGSVVASWLLDLTAISLLEQPTLERFSGRVSDSGEGRGRYLPPSNPLRLRRSDCFSIPEVYVARRERLPAKVLSAMRFQFGGHIEKVRALRFQGSFRARG